MNDLRQQTPAVLPSGPAPNGLLSLGAQISRRLARRRRPLAVGFSIAAHLLAVFALVSVRADPPKHFVPMLMSVQLVELQPPADPTPAPPTAEPAPAKAPPRKSPFRRTPSPPADADPLPAGDDPVAQAGVEVSDAELAGASTAGSGPPGGACNMPRLLQDALRRDRMVQAAVAGAHRGKAIRVWNGDWVRHPGQEGDGLAAVREAIMWEVGFAPEACRSQRVHGLVMLSLNDGPGAARLVVGDGDWRWSDLLFQR